MNKYLIFRTDRIGDFLLSSILIKSIKKNDKNSQITLVSSEKNHEYIKKFELVDRVILYPKKGLKKKLNFIKSLKKEYFFCIIALDGKKRSILNSIFLNGKTKICITTKKFYTHLFALSFSNIFLDNLDVNKIDIIKKIINYLNFSFDKSDLNVIKNKKFNSNLQNNSTSSLLEGKKFTLFHFDEKWISTEYIKTYKTIEPKKKYFKEFIYELINTSKQNLILTTGEKNNFIIDDFKSNLEKINTNCYYKKINDFDVIFYENTNFFDIEFLLSKSNFLISCHGAATHVASGLDIKILDIIDDSEKRLFNRFSYHFRNYNYLIRKDFTLLSKEILDSL